MHAKGLCRSLGFAYRIREDPESNGQNYIFSPIERRNCSIWLFTNSGLSTFELCPARGTHTRGMPSTLFYFLYARTRASYPSNHFHAGKT